MSSALGFFHSLFFRCWHVIMSKKDGAVGVVQYDEKVKRRSLDDPLRYHRRSSIPFVDRKPAVRFIRNVQQSEPSESGPKTPANDDSSKHPILKKSNFPILVSSGSDSGEAGRESIGTTNDELDNCKNKTDLIMDKISRAERIARGSMDVLTFPTATRRVEALSRYQGSLTISICTLDILTSSSAYEKDKKKSRQIVSQLQPVVDCVQEMQNHANSFQSTAKTFLSRAKRRYNEWETLLKRNSEFKMENSKLNYPIYSHKRPPESVTLFEDTVEDPQGHSIDGYVRICRKYPEDQITVHCDTSEQADQFDPITFQDSSIETQAEVIKFVTKHGKELLGYSDAYLGQGLEMLVDKEIDEAFDVIQRKIKSIQYDDCFDPLCALELKVVDKNYKFSQ